MTQLETALKYNWNIYTCEERGWRSPYSDSLRAKRSWDRIPVEARFSAPILTGSGAHPASCTMGKGGVDHPPPSSAEVHRKE